MADVFISYSRHNVEFARRLFNALEQGGRESWIDWDSIPLSVEWWKAIQEGIEAANGFVFIITPESLASPVCALEVAHAISSHKRIIPVIHIETDISATFGKLAAVVPAGNLADILDGRDLLDVARKNWSVLEGINWLYFREADEFGPALKQLINVVEMDFGRVRLHTRMLVRANEWREKKFDKGSLLAGSDLREAENWLNSADDKPPLPTELHRAYIRASLHQEAEEEAERQRQIAAFNAASERAGRLSRRAGVATIIAGLLMLGLIGVAAFAGGQVASAEERIAVAQATLMPIPATLTQAAALREDALQGQNILTEMSAVLLNVQSNIAVNVQIARAERLVAAYPNNPLAYRARGLVRMVLNDYPGALEDYTHAISLAPNFGDALLSRGNLYVTLGDYTRADADLTRLIELEPARETAYFNRAVARASLGLLDLAVADYTRVIELDSTYAEALNNRGAVYFQLANYELAAADFQRAIQLGMDDVQTYGNLNRALAQLQTPTHDLTALFTPAPPPTLTRPMVLYSMPPMETFAPPMSMPPPGGSAPP
jgi:tetratricopeptide (TPR) repeat protein